MKMILGIDWGKSKIGIALADDETKIAFAYDILKNDKDLLNKLKNIILEKEVNEVVVGIPKFVFHKGGEENGGKTLGEKMRSELNVNVFYQEEMFTTKTAKNNLIQKGKKGVGKIDDSEAARIILQEWLDFRK